VPEAAEPQKCKACHMCEMSCPDLALYVVKEGSSDA
jgi:NAD-dependent dihydropyrimidine dehydrogenase PreA subunit